MKQKGVIFLLTFQLAPPEVKNQPVCGIVMIIYIDGRHVNWRINTQVQITSDTSKTQLKVSFKLENTRIYSHLNNCHLKQLFLISVLPFVYLYAT